jgi:hypothetical protein
MEKRLNMAVRFFQELSLSPVGTEEPKRDSNGDTVVLPYWTKLPTETFFDKIRVFGYRHLVVNYPIMVLKSPFRA